jgi:hypothetical protein
MGQRIRDGQIEPFAMTAQMRYVIMQQSFVETRLRGRDWFSMMQGQALRVTGLKLLHSSIRIATDAKFDRSIGAVGLTDDV